MENLIQDIQNLKKLKENEFSKSVFFLVFRVWEGQLKLDKDESYRYCIPTTPLQNEILVDPLGFEMKKGEHKL